MNIKALNDCKIRITLDDSETEELFGGYDKIDYNDPLTRTVLHAIIKKALPDNLFLHNCRQLAIEVRPDGGGCTIDLIKKGLLRPTRLYPPKCWRLDFFDTESMINALCTLYEQKNGFNGSCSLYRGERGYQAVVSATQRVVETIKHYCLVNSSPLAIASTEEYASVVCKKNAVEIIGKAFSKKV